MARTIKLDKYRSLRDLERQLRRYEAVFGALQCLRRRQNDILATFETGREPKGKLGLIRDSSGRTALPAGAEILFRGIVYANGRPARIVAFRSAAAERNLTPAVRVRRGVGTAAIAGAGLRGRSRSAAAKPRARSAARRAWDETEASAHESLSDGMGGAIESSADWVTDAGEAFAPVEQVKSNEYRIWFGTNRKPIDAADISKGFSGARGGRTRHGYCDVFVPKSHEIGSIGSSALRRLLRWSDDRLKLRQVAALEPEPYWAAVADQVAQIEPGKRHAVVFIHGYNVSFEEAAIRAAQIGFDLGVGAMAFFSWPSKGLPTRRAYQSDGQTIGASEAAIADFLVDFARLSGAETVHVIVHSMGNQGVLRAMNGIFTDAERRGGCRFGQIILAAADVDSETFGRLADAYRRLSARTTLYVSKRDLALKASAWFADYPRVGLYPPVSVFDGIDTVSVSNIDLTLLGHGYVGEARDVLQDMHRLIFDGAPPPRFGLKECRNDEGKAYWEVGA
ncbi:MAG TPA: alpha/beta hydrolase [Allosphingosinicella sp.]|nr:alpha/beta hydrolase [Allosphingosinicella sp.]